MNNRLIKSNDAGGGGCTNTVDLYNPFPDGGGVALYQLNGDATDVSGNYDGTASNVTYGAGQFGQAGVFNGSSSYINTNFIVPSLSSYSASIWFKTSTTGIRRNLLSDDSNPSNGINIRLFLGLRETNKFVFVLGNGSSAWADVTTVDALPYLDNNWHNAVLVISGTSVKLYVDGSLIGNLTSSVSAGTLGTQNLIIGAGEQGTGDNFNGSIDQVRIFSRALRPYEVEALYTEEYCTPTIVPSEHFNTVTYTGNDLATGIQVTGVGFQPDLVWIKARTATQNHDITDSVRGTHKWLASNLTQAETNEPSYGIDSFDSDGFTISSSGGRTNASFDYVSWNFKAGGYDNTFNVLENGSTTSSATAAGAGITAGSITTGWSVSANRDAGFSIVSWTGNSTAGATVGHGLSDTPKMIIVKSRNEIGGSSKNWTVYSEEIGNTQYLYLNTTDAASVYNFWNNTSPTNSVFSVSSDTNVNSSVGNYIAYCFAEVEGFSSFGSYVGNGSTEGPKIITGFEPAIVITKMSNGVGSNWWVHDNKRDPENPRVNNLRWNLSDAEQVNNADTAIDFLENGFQIKTSYIEANNSGDTFIYMAFAADPTTVEPTLEDSFNTVLYEGNQTANKSVTGVGFQPDFVWIKNRDNARDNALFDSVRGKYKFLSSNLTDSEQTYTNTFESFDSDGFTVNESSTLNWDSMVAWCWKGAELPAINSNGSITSVVSANPAAGFSIATWTGQGGSGTIGHGLGVAPKFMIVKNRTTAVNWLVQTTVIDGSNDYLFLNTTGAASDSSESVPTNTIYDLSPGFFGNESANNFVGYFFAEVAGFSKFGSYAGNSSTNGPVIDCGFEPAFVMIKGTDAITNWSIYDNRRDTSNPRNHILWSNLSDAELVAYTQTDIDFNATSFQLRGTNGGINQTGRNYIYMAFANQF